MRIVGLSLMLMLALAGARAEHCPNGEIEPDPTSIDPCRQATIVVCLYVDYDLDPAEPGCDGSGSLFVTLYMDSNGIPGYQRADECQDDTCHGLIESDTIIF